MNNTVTIDREKLYNLLECLVDEDECSFDHHGGCQAHGYISLEKGEQCPVQEGKDLIESLKVIKFCEPCEYYTGADNCRFGKTSNKTEKKSCKNKKIATIPTPEPESNEDWKDRYCVNCCCAFDDLGKKCTERNNCDSHNFIHQLIQAERQKAISIMDECIERPKGIVPDSYHLFDAIEREK